MSGWEQPGQQIPCPWRHNRIKRTGRRLISGEREVLQCLKLLRANRLSKITKTELEARWRFYVCILHVCMVISIHMFTCVHMCVVMHTHGGQRLALGVFLHHSTSSSIPLPQRQESVTATGAHLPSKPRGSNGLCLPSTRITCGMCTTMYGSFTYVLGIKVRSTKTVNCLDLDLN